jgi:hypothetical protein
MTKQEQLQKQIELENEAHSKAIRIKKESGRQEAIKGIIIELNLLKDELSHMKIRIEELENEITKPRKGMSNG